MTTKKHILIAFPILGVHSKYFPYHVVFRLDLKGFPEEATIN